MQSSGDSKIPNDVELHSDCSMRAVRAGQGCKARQRCRCRTSMQDWPALPVEVKDARSSVCRCRTSMQDWPALPLEVKDAKLGSAASAGLECKTGQRCHWRSRMQDRVVQATQRPWWACADLCWFMGKAPERVGFDVHLLFDAHILDARL
eukprot:1150295-Pelagomonas_calceolata.AAC.2